MSDHDSLLRRRLAVLTGLLDEWIGVKLAAFLLGIPSGAAVGSQAAIIGWLAFRYLTVPGYDPSMDYAAGSVILPGAVVGAVTGALVGLGLTTEASAISRHLLLRIAAGSILLIGCCTGIARLFPVR